MAVVISLKSRNSSARIIWILDKTQRYTGLLLHDLHPSIILVLEVGGKKRVYLNISELWLVSNKTQIICKREEN